MLNRVRLAIVVGLITATAARLYAAEMVELNEKNWNEYVPAGKEVDGIYGDYALRSDRLIAIVGKAVNTRHANMTIKDVGGALIDLTRRSAPSDQLGCFYPHAGAYVLEGPVEWPDEFAPNGNACRVAFRAKPIDGAGTPRSADLQMIVGYELVDGADHLAVKTLVKNATAQPIEIQLADSVRADGEFQTGIDSRLNLWWCYDAFWKQAYGVQPAGADIVIHAQSPEGKGLSRLQYQFGTGNEMHVVAAGKSLVFERRIFPAANTLATQATARRLRGDELAAARISVMDVAGPIPSATVRINAEDTSMGDGRTDQVGKLSVELPPGKYQCQSPSTVWESRIPNLAPTVQSMASATCGTRTTAASAWSCCQDGMKS
jgi:hypothetical protein